MVKKKYLFRSINYFTYRIIWTLIYRGTSNAINNNVVFSTLKATVQRAVRQVEMNRSLIYGHLAKTKKQKCNLIKKNDQNHRARGNTYRTDSKAFIIASSDQGVGFDLDNSMPSRLQRPYNVPTN